MNFIKLKDEKGNTILVNLDLVSSINGISEDTTIIFTGQTDEYISFNIPIEEFEAIIVSEILGVPRQTILNYIKEFKSNKN